MINIYIIIYIYNKIYMAIAAIESQVSGGCVLDRK